MVMTDDSVLSKALRDPPCVTDIPPNMHQSYLRCKMKVYEMKLLGHRLRPPHDTCTDISGTHTSHTPSLENDLTCLQQELCEPLTFARGGYTHTIDGPAFLTILRRYQDSTRSKDQAHLGWCVDVRVTLVEGKHHQLRRIAKRSGLVMVALRRVCIASILHVDSVPEPGECRWLTVEEVEALYEGLGLK